MGQTQIHKINMQELNSELKSLFSYV